MGEEWRKQRPPPRVILEKHEIPNVSAMRITSILSYRPNINKCI